MGREEGEEEKMEKAGPGPSEPACVLPRLCVKEPQGLMQVTNISGPSLLICKMGDWTG